MKRAVIFAGLGFGLVMAGCNAAPQESSDPLAAVCPGSAAEVAGIRAIFEGFVEQARSTDDAETFANETCDQNADPGADFDACMACMGAAIDEAYGE